MNCTTIKKGKECLFMTTNGCSFNGGVCHTTVDQCDGCARSTEHASAWYCAACPEPASKWKNGNCNLATHVKAGTSASKTKINPLKASKRANKKR